MNLRTPALLSLLVAPVLTLSAENAGAPPPPAETAAFLARVMAHVPAVPATGEYASANWAVPKRPTDEVVAVLGVATDNQKMLDQIFDLDHYTGNIDHVLESRTIKDARFTSPYAKHFYQKIDVPMIGKMHHELALVDGGDVNGWRVIYWYLLEKESAALPDSSVRSQYNVGAWMLKPEAIGYALSSAPVRDDVNMFQWAALTKGADLAAGKVIKANIQGMVKWATTKK